MEEKNSNPILDEDLQNGYQYFFTGRYNEAKNMFKKALVKDPKNNDAIVGLTGVYKAIGEPELAKDYMLNVLKNEKTPTNYLIYADTCIEIGHYDDAIDASQKAILLDKNDEMAYLRLSEAYYKKGDLNNAEKAALEGYATKPFLELTISLGDIYLAMKKYQDALKFFREGTKLDKNNKMELNVSIGRCLNLMGRYCDAYDVLIKEKFGKDRNYNLGLSLIHQKKFKEAIKYFNEEDSENNICIADCYKNLGKHKKAEKAYSKAIMQDNSNPYWYILTASFFNQIKDFKNCLKYVSLGLKNAPDKKLYVQKAYALIGLKRVNEARTAIIEGSKIADDGLGTQEKLDILKLSLRNIT